MVAFRLRSARSRGSTPFPIITSSATVTVSEGADLNHALTSDKAGTWAIVGGADQAQFSIVDDSTLFLPAQDYTPAGDADGNNSYIVQVALTASGNGLVTQQTVTVTVLEAVASAGGTDYAFAPFLRDQTLYRTTLVDAGDEVIDLQSELATPFSPTATSWSITGADADKLSVAGPGRYVFNPSTRASLAGTSFSVTVQASNDYGTSDAATLTVVVPADSKCWFCDYENGSDAATGRTPALAKKHMHGTAAYTGSAVTALNGDDYVFFRGDQRHRYTIAKASNAVMDHEGTAGNPVVFSFTGWGETRAIVSGDDIVTGWNAVTQSEVGNNANWASIEKLDLTSQGGAMEYYQHLYCGGVMMYPAQTPTPVDLREFEDPSTDNAGMYRVTNTTSTGTTPRMSQSGTTVTVVDARLATVFGANNPTGFPAVLWNSSNNIITGTVASYNQATSTVTITTSGTIRSGTSAYGISHHPVQISEPGQFALSPDRLTLYAWRPNTEETGVSRRQRGMTLGKAYVEVVGGQWERHAGTGSIAASGVAFAFTSSSAYKPDIRISDHIVRHNRADGGDGAGVHVTTGANGGFDNGILERFLFDENPKASAFRFSGKFNGILGGTPDQVRANAGGKIRWNYLMPGGIHRTFLLTQYSDGAHIYENVARDNPTVHGNIFSPYTSAGSTTYNRYLVFELNYVDNCERAATCSVHDTLFTTDRHNLWTRNLFIGSGDTNTVQFSSGEPGSTFTENIVLGGPDYPYSGSTMYIDEGRRIVVTNNVLGGVDYDVANVATGEWTVSSNLLTVNTLPPDNGTTRVVADNAVATGAPFKVWDGEITEEMADTLGAGRIGVFHTVP